MPILQEVYATLCALVPKPEARLILRQRSGFDEAALILRAREEISPSLQEMMFEDARAYQAGKPLSRIYGQGTFWGLDFVLSPETLDPRQDTEVLIDCVLKKTAPDSPLRILDLGTGTGCILITLLNELKHARGIGIDLAQGAVANARANAARHGVASRAQFLQGAWFAPLKAGERFDLIVSNPPYIAADVIPTLSAQVREHDPILALEGGADGLLAYRQIFSALKAYLNLAGFALFEIGYDQGESVVRLAGEYGLDVRGVHPDLAGRARVVEISCGDK